MKFVVRKIDNCGYCPYHCRDEDSFCFLSRTSDIKRQITELLEKNRYMDYNEVASLIIQIIIYDNLFRESEYDE